tara:strand:- start:1403 stop:2752 length:1350 start_codon:yes stop_codon:yes gene_type:complete
MSSEEEKPEMVIEKPETEEELELSRLTKLETLDMNYPVESLKAMFELFTPSGEEHAMIALVSRFLTQNEIEFSVDESGNMYFKNHIEGPNRFIINAHMDTVANGVAELEVLESTPNQTIIQSTNNQVIGADDKCGVYAVLKMITDKEIDIPLTGLLCVSEEIGCVGSSYAMKHHSDYFADCIFCITVDRRGDTDIITTNSDVKLSSDDIIKKLDELGADFGYKHCTGSISDVSQIVQALNINGINMAAGYYGAHTGSEKVVVEELLRSTDWLSVVMIPSMHKHLLENAELITYKPTAAVSSWSYGGGYRYSNGYYNTWSYDAGKSGVYGGYGASKLATEPTEHTDDLEDVLDMFQKVIDDVELMNGWYMLEGLTEDACYKLSSTGKSIIIVDGWANYAEELEVVNRNITVGRGGKSGFDANILIDDIEDYIESLETTGFNCFDENGEWI